MKHVITKETTEIKAPSGYPKEYAEAFAELPEKWRNYLCERENEIDFGCHLDSL